MATELPERDIDFMRGQLLAMLATTRMLIDLASKEPAQRAELHMRLLSLDAQMNGLCDTEACVAGGRAALSMLMPPALT